MTLQTLIAAALIWAGIIAIAIAIGGSAHV